MDSSPIFRAPAFLHGLADLLWPRRCPACRGPSGRDGPLCASCAAALPWLDPDLCERCQDAWAIRPTPRCAGCLDGGGALEACGAAVAFEGAVATWIHRLKYPRPGLTGLDPEAESVVRALVRDAARHFATPESAVVPLPLHPARVRTRGFNPAVMLAREVARTTGGRLEPSLVARVRDTPSQTGLGRSARRRNVVGAFEARGRAPRRVTLVDDVVTTGSTLEEAARSLRAAGARSVRAVCAARTAAPP